jgi:hypothetical protein
VAYWTLDVFVMLEMIKEYMCSIHRQASSASCHQTRGLTGHLMFGGGTTSSLVANRPLSSLLVLLFQLNMYTAHVKVSL